MLPDLLRQFFWYLNRYLMVPMFRLGLGPIIGNPFSGYIMVIKTKGRKSGITRYSPVNYAILNGNVYCLAGWGHLSDWYRNLVANPEVELILPSGGLVGRAETVSDPAERRTALRQVLRAAGFAAAFEGFNLSKASDEELEQKTASQMVVRIRPSGLAAGPCDSGGWAWIGVFTLSAVIFFLGRRKK
jgi:deazaflavin-dependent oxidoreductase (nitroreductase family)